MVAFCKVLFTFLWRCTLSCDFRNEPLETIFPCAICFIDDFKFFVTLSIEKDLVLFGWDKRIYDELLLLYIFFFESLLLGDWLWKDERICCLIASFSSSKIFVTSLWALSLFAILDLKGERFTTPSLTSGSGGSCSGLNPWKILTSLDDLTGDNFWGEVAVKLKSVSEFYTMSMYGNDCS